MVSIGLTIGDRSDVSPTCRRAVGFSCRTIARHVGAVKTALVGVCDNQACLTAPDKTCALIASEGRIVGLDARGYITWVGSACDMSDLPALTGFVPTCGDGEPGEMVSTPEVVLGLAIIRVFERSPALAGILSEVNLRDIEQPKAILSRGIVVDLGSGGYRTKAERLAQVLVQATHLNMIPKSVDLRFDRQVVVKWSRMDKGQDKEA